MATNAPALLIPSPPASATNTVAELDIREVKAPLPIADVRVWLTGLLALAVLAVLGWWAWRYWRRKQQAAVPEILILPHVRARERLRAALELISEPEPFCVAVSAAVRIYLEERFDLRAPERTTEEFLEDLRASALLALSQKQALADFLTRCDLVKFARYEPAETELMELHAAAERLVEETAPGPFLPPPTSTGASLPTAAAGPPGG